MASAVADLYVPPGEGGSWETVAPEDAGWDPARLAAVFDFIGESNSTSALLLAGGRIVAERYWGSGGQERTRAVASVQKSLTALLIGIAQADGLLRIDDQVNRWLGSGWSRAPADDEAAITIRHLLAMTSGLNDDLTFQAPAGTLWRYNTDAYYRVKACLEAASGVTMQAYTEATVWHPIGDQSSRWAGDLLARPPGQQWHATARGMARFGLLVLRGGRWNGTSLLPDSAYLADALQPSQPLNPAYGYLWWLNGGAGYLLPGGARGAGRFIPAAPPDLVAALGAGDQKIYVVPSLDLVLVRQGQAAQDAAAAVSRWDAQLWQQLMAARITATAAG